MPISQIPAAMPASSYVVSGFSRTVIWKIIAASAVGTMIEWYDFYIFGSLATTISPLFYPPGDDWPSGYCRGSRSAGNTGGPRCMSPNTGATAGQGVVWYTGQFYALFYLQTILNVHAISANYIIAIALVFGMPFFVVFGALSDRLGRKKIMMAGCLIAVITYIPIYRAMQAVPGSNVVTAVSQRNPVTGAILLTPMTRIEDRLEPARQALPYTDFGTFIAAPAAWSLIALVFIQVLFVTMVYGPIAAYLVEAFPARIRYTALSLP